MSQSHRGPLVVLPVVACIALAGCGSALDRLNEVGQTPKLSAIDDPTTKPGYKPVSLPMPTPESVAYAPNSLWRAGSRTFFKDQRARRIGDLLTVKVTINDTAQVANETKRSRTTADTAAINGLPGSLVKQVIPKSVDTGSLIDNASTTTSDGNGSINRSETLTTNIAAMVTQVLPNGNMVIEGKQEIRVNFEVRELIVAGIVRPADIASDNTIDSSKIAEARIAYGGRGQITDLQQPRYGSQVIDVLMPF
ncbi:MAG: flagellar basal body L-ring protein FlgH [Ancalomicrobiaceae bacterium]|nr:flagellar basal body L-ring protein FlgH [Ancalomicrobiaceae bacterium]